VSYNSVIPAMRKTILATDVVIKADPKVRTLALAINSLATAWVLWIWCFFKHVDADIRRVLLSKGEATSS
jgi:hypothetical protein